MNLPSKLLGAQSMTNANASTLPKNRVVGTGTPTSSNRMPVDSLHTTGASKIAGCTDADIPSGEVGNIYGKDGEVVTLENDGSDTIAFGARVYAVAGASLAAGGRVAALPGSLSSGTVYNVVGFSVTPETVPATAGAKVRVRWQRFDIKG